jgi:two-component system, OmpR family, response regulator
MKTRILFADDDSGLRETLKSALDKDGFESIVAPDGASALSMMRCDAMIAMAVLDIAMPLMDGLEVLKELRARGDGRPILILTSRDDEFDRVLGLELGADDYLTKPFSLRELAARMRAVLRRSTSKGEGVYGSASRVVRSGPLVLDADSFKASYGGSELRLTITEFRMLASLAEGAGAVRTREQLLAAAFPDDAYQSDRAVDCHMRRLRKKLSEVIAPEEFIETIYGLGYRIALHGSKTDPEGSERNSKRETTRKEAP